MFLTLSKYYVLVYKVVSPRVSMIIDMRPRRSTNIDSENVLVDNSSRFLA